MPTAFLCDFDGTVSPTDIGAAFVRRFSPGRARERHELLERWRLGRLGHRALTEAELDLVRADERQAIGFARDYRLDPAFQPFVHRALERGDEVMVVSEGFDFYVRDLLERHGLGGLPVAANRVRFEGRRATAEFPFADPGCPGCGNCKAQHVRRYRSRGYRTVLVGDGLSDRCGARCADQVLARAGSSLASWCAGEGIAHATFRSFADVAAIAEAGGFRRAAGA
jgi:HAD superfamily phosphoserine phosphatase-like hydrolase